MRALKLSDFLEKTGSDSQGLSTNLQSTVIESKYVWLELYLASGLWSSWWLSLSHMPLYVCSSCWVQVSVRVIMSLEVNSEWCCRLREVICTCFNVLRPTWTWVCACVCARARMCVRYSHTFREWGVGICRGPKGIKKSRVWEKMAHSTVTLGKIYTLWIVFIILQVSSQWYFWVALF